MSDLINRQDAIDCFWDENRMMRDWLDIIKDIRSLPSAEPEILACGNGELDAQTERKSGEWVACQDGKYHCSRCDDVAPKGYRWSYCPNCGARMDGEEEGWIC